MSIIKTAIHPIQLLLDKIFFRLTKMAFSAQTERNYVISCDLFSEELTSPQDGFEFFRYAYQQNQPEIQPFYLMNAKSGQFREIRKQYGNRIIPYSRDLLHSFVFRIHLIRLFRHTRFIVESFKMLSNLRMGINEAVKNNPETYYIFIQHGITFFKDEYISPRTYSPFFYDKIMVSNDFEKDIFLSRACFSESDIFRNGLLRWDLLTPAPKEEKRQRSIFIYFTYRKYLKKMTDVTQSVYLQSILNLLNYPDFKELTQRHGYSIKIGLHHSLVMCLGKDVLSGIETLSDDDIAAAKRESDILVTDYSSMCFEMWFQNKPVIFFNIPDAEDCIFYGYNTDLAYPYRNKEDLLFNIVQTPGECIELLKTYFENGWAIPPEEKKKAGRFFYYSSGFCARFYQYLLDLRKQRKQTQYVKFNHSMKLDCYSALITRGIGTPNTFNGRWVIRRNASLCFHVRETTRDLMIELVFNGLIAQKQKKIHAVFSINGKKAHDVIITDMENHSLLFFLPNQQIPHDGIIRIDIHTSRCHSQRKPDSIKTKGEHRLSLNLQSLIVAERDYSRTEEEQLRKINSLSCPTE